MTDQERAVAIAALLREATRPDRVFSDVRGLPTVAKPWFRRKRDIAGFDWPVASVRPVSTSRNGRRRTPDAGTRWEWWTGAMFSGSARKYGVCDTRVEAEEAADAALIADGWRLL